MEFPCTKTLRSLYLGDLNETIFKSGDPGPVGSLEQTISRYVHDAGQVNGTFSASESICSTIEPLYYHSLGTGMYDAINEVMHL